MADETPKNDGNGDAGDGLPAFSEQDKARARQWFAKAQQVLDTRSYDYAIESFINGLQHWPEAVEEGHKPLYAAALFRAAAGGKKPGTMEQFKHPTGGKDAKKAMLNAEFLMAKDPKNPGHLEAVFKNATKARFYDAAMWVGPVYQDAILAEKKPSPSRYRLLVDTYCEIGEAQTERNPAMAIEALQRAVMGMARYRQADPKNLDLTKEQTDLATRLTILKGRYEDAESFKDSIENAEAQKDIQDTERVVQSDQRLDELIQHARDELAVDPDDHARINKLIDLLVKRENDDVENEAIETLHVAYKRTNHYPFKMRADDIKIRQLNRKSRHIVAQGDREAARKQYREQLKFELRVFRERCEQYPTDMRVRFEFGKRLFQAHNYDNAIPILQQARNDPKYRTRCNFHIGRCFFELGYQDQAIGVLNEAIHSYEIEGDATSKDLHYWLGRAHEAAGQPAEALKVYGQLLQWDYNYRDVRKRMDDLRKGGGDGQAAT
jgi:thioredoxin-like negative regulator of GroEL